MRSKPFNTGAIGSATFCRPWRVQSSAPSSGCLANCSQAYKYTNFPANSSKWDENRIPPALGARSARAQPGTSGVCPGRNSGPGNGQSTGRKTAQSPGKSPLCAHRDPALAKSRKAGQRRRRRSSSPASPSKIRTTEEGSGIVEIVTESRNAVWLPSRL